MLELLMPYLLGAVATVVASKLGIKIPFIQPAPPSVPTPTVPSPVSPPASPILDLLSALLSALLKVKAGELKLDDHSKETVKLIQTTLKDFDVK